MFYHAERKDGSLSLTFILLILLVLKIEFRSVVTLMPDKTTGTLHSLHNSNTEMISILICLHTFLTFGIQFNDDDNLKY